MNAEELKAFAPVLVASIRIGLGFDPTKPVASTTEARLIRAVIERLEAEKAGGSV